MVAFYDARSFVPFDVALVAVVAEQTCAVDDRIHHRVGHSEEEDPDKISIVDMRCVHERVHDKRHLTQTTVYAPYYAMPLPQKNASHCQIFNKQK